MRIEHTALYVSDLEAARDFFVTHLEGRANGGYHNQRQDSVPTSSPLTVAPGWS